jgi:hypothetical protein
MILRERERETGCPKEREKERGEEKHRVRESDWIPKRERKSERETGKNVPLEKYWQKERWRYSVRLR